MHFIKIGFDQDLTQCALERITERCILVFPTRASANQARLRFEAKWELQELIWTSMEDFKAMALASDTPLLEDEKRLLCLYQVMNEEERDYFHISIYDDLVDWGNHFFRFLQEYSEAGYDVLEFGTLQDRVELNLKGWQEKHIGHLCKIIHRYHQKIQAMGFSDRIFRMDPAQESIPFQDYRIIFVNQYYYSKREQELIRQCARVNEIMLIYQGAEPDETHWPKLRFDPKKCFASLSTKPKIIIHECENEDQHALALLSSLPDAVEGAIIDHSFVSKPYSAWFDERLSFGRQYPITHSSWFAFLSFLDDLAQSQSRTPGFIPLSLVIHHLRDPRFPQMLDPEWEPLQQEKLMRELFKLSGDGTLYLDMEPWAQFSNDKKFQLVPQLCRKLFSLVRDILNLENCEDLISLISDELDPQKLASAEEQNKTDLLAQVWTAMANFRAVEELGVVSTWHGIFPALGSGIFRLWLDFLKPICLSLRQEKSTCSWEISNLLDSRNRNWDTLFFLQMVEGSVPQSPDPVWLLNEAQRGRLGMIRYDDIRAWERYYFFRLVFSAKVIHIFSYRNPERNVEPSSFIGELMQIFAVSEASQRLTHIIQPRIPISQVFQQRQSAKSKTSKLSRGSVDEDFFRLPIDPEQDFGAKGEVEQTSYGLSLLVSNPFAWYIRSHRKLDLRLAEPEETISPILFGNLMHAYFNEILGEESSRHHDLSQLKKIFTDFDGLSLRLQQLICGDEFIYKIPKNYNADFLSSIISRHLAESLQEFYRRFLAVHLRSGAFTLIPEKRFMTDEEKVYKTLCEVKHASKNYKLKIRGKADLRIESESNKIIVDFKTGSASEDQLIVYEYFYYLITDPQLDNLVRSYIWQILQMKVDPCSYKVQRKRLSFVQKLEEALQDCLTNGYGTGDKRASQQILKAITRSDLYLEKGEASEV